MHLTPLLSLLGLAASALASPVPVAVTPNTNTRDLSSSSPNTAKSASNALSAALNTLLSLTTCPPPPGTPASAPKLSGYTVTFTNYTGLPLTGHYTGPPIGAATNGDGYFAYTLSNTTKGCLEACDARAECAFVNVYRDVRFDSAGREEKHVEGTYTCGLYKRCPMGTEANDNFGQQARGDGVRQGEIRESSGYCTCGKGTA